MGSEMCIRDSLSTLSIANKWLEKDPTLLKVGDVVILKPETLEKNQWRIARITDLHRNLDGVPTTDGHGTVALQGGAHPHAAPDSITGTSLLGTRQPHCPCRRGSP